MARPKTTDVRKIFSLSADLAQQIDNFRFANRIKTEAEAIRRLIETGLAASGQKKPKKPRD